MLSFCKLEILCSQSEFQTVRSVMYFEKLLEAVNQFSA